MQFKHKSILAMMLVLLPTHHLFGLSSKKQQITYSFGGCGTGLAVGIALSGSLDDSSDRTATIAANTAAGCLLGIVAGWIFVDDDQDVLMRKIDAQEKTIRDLEGSIRSSTSTGSDKPKYLDFLTLERNYQGGSSLEKMVNLENCILHKFYLSFNGRSLEDHYIPVDEGIVVKGLEYYVVRPKDPADKSVVCVNPQNPYGYLGLELPGLGDALFNHAKSTLKRDLRGGKNQ